MWSREVLSRAMIDPLIYSYIKRHPEGTQEQTSELIISLSINSEVIKETTVHLLNNSVRPYTTYERSADAYYGLGE